MDPIAVYVHIPFCPRKCGYCDFNSYAMAGDIIEETTDAIVTQILTSPLRGRPAKTVFFGGGTPTFLSAESLGRVLAAVLEIHPPLPQAEITSEANPGTVDSEKFRAMREAGFNRISLGAQSFDTSDLIRLGRVHAPGDVGLAVARARAAGFQRINVDLMFGLPGQSLQGWRKNLELALQLKTDHLSLYGLTIEQNTRFFRFHQRGLLDLPDDDVQAEMYDLAVRLCASHGLAQYEISNFAKPGHECQHNLAYWRCEEYAAYGPGAVGCVGPWGARRRYTNLKGPQLYVQAVRSGQPGFIEEETVDLATQETERVMMGLRTTEGISAAGLDQEEVERLITSGHISRTGDRVALTPQGRIVANQVMARLIPG